jgi:hypothetical protein
MNAMGIISGATRSASHPFGMGTANAVPVRCARWLREEGHALTDPARTGEDVRACPPTRLSPAAAAERGRADAEVAITRLARKFRIGTNLSARRRLTFRCVEGTARRLPLGRGERDATKPVLATPASAQSVRSAAPGHSARAAILPLERKFRKGTNFQAPQCVTLGSIQTAAAGDPASGKGRPVAGAMRPGGRTQGHFSASVCCACACATRWS